MSLIEKLYYNTWNIGFIERSISDVILSPDTELNEGEAVHVPPLTSNSMLLSDVGVFVNVIVPFTVRLLTVKLPSTSSREMISPVAFVTASTEPKERLPVAVRIPMTTALTINNARILKTVRLNNTIRFSK